MLLDGLDTGAVPLLEGLDCLEYHLPERSTRKFAGERKSQSLRSHETAFIALGSGEYELKLCQEAGCDRLVEVSSLLLTLQRLR